MTDETVVALRDEALSNTAYLVDLGDGRALAVDPSRDLRAIRQAAGARDLRISFVAETHLHADFLTGAVQLAADDGATVLASAAGNREFPHVGLEDQQEVDLAGLTMHTLATPGHTGEHLAYELRDGTHTLGVFTGGSLIVGGAARTDLVDPKRTEELARAQYRSLHRLAELPDEVTIWPTHGSGSFCTPGADVSGPSSTIGAERTANPMLAAPDEDSFVRLMLASLGSFPSYFLRLGEENRRGPAVLPGHLELASVAPDADALVLDVRPAASFAAGHPTAALSIPFRSAFTSWLGWLAPHDRPLVLLREDDQDVEELLWQAAKIGYTNVVGEVAGGVETWREAGLPMSTTPLREAFRAPNARVIDVRQAAEYEAGHAPGAVNVELGELADRIADLPDVPTVVMCGHGERAMGAASILESHNFDQVTVLAGGPEDWAALNPEDQRP